MSASFITSTRSGGRLLDFRIYAMKLLNSLRFRTPSLSMSKNLEGFREFESINIIRISYMQIYYYLNIYLHLISAGAPPWAVYGSIAANIKRYSLYDSPQRSVTSAALIELIRNNSLIKVGEIKKIIPKDIRCIFSTPS